MCHCHITRVMYVALVGFFITTGLVVAIYFNSINFAQATIGQQAFGGPVLVTVPLPIPTLTGACPAHTVILDYALTIPKPIGLVTAGVGTGTGLTFDYGNLVTPGVQTLGEHSLIPIPTCGGLPYPVYFTFYNPTYLRFQIGTSLLPSF